MPRTPQDVLALVKEQRVEFISLQFTDIVGMVKNVTIPVAALPDALDHGVWFDGSSIDSFARIAESDMYLVPDLATYAPIPWDANVTTARLICNVYTPNGRSFPGDPRQLLIAALQEATDMGYEYLVGAELEFFLFKADLDKQITTTPNDQASYFDSSNNQASPIRRPIIKALQAFGIEIEASHHEVAPGQHEIDLRHTNALQAADAVITMRVALKTIAQQQGLYATFMPKPMTGVNGNGMHCHQSLVDIASGKNAFHDAKDPYAISGLARNFIAGQLAHAPGMIAILAPLVNSYKRLVLGYEAPVYLSWSRTNRSSLVRVPRLAPSRTQSSRVELRCPDPSCNPYLAFAVMLKSGLDGVKRTLPLPEPAEEDLYQVDPRARGMETLPPSLGDALDALREDELVQAALGSYIYERFIEAKSQEWADYRIHVSGWELDRYLPIY